MRSASTTLLVVVLLTSCGDSGEEVPMPSTLVELDQLCAVLAKAECDRLTACGLLPSADDQAACVTREKDVRCARVELEARRLITGSEFEMNREAAARCRDDISSADCELGHRGSLFDGAVCRQIWVPQVIEGGACSSSLSCGEGLVCVVTNACPGTCIRPLGNNQPCDFDTVCDDTTFCSATAMRCRQRVARDQACEQSISGNPCEDASWCDFGRLGGPVCAAAGGRGFGCESSFQCAAGARCISGSCSSGLESDSCMGSFDCQGGRVCADGRCTTPLAAGAACEVGVSACFEGTVCLGETCAPLAADGEACEASADCYAGRSCEASVCRLVDTCFL